MYYHSWTSHAFGTKKKIFQELTFSEFTRKLMIFAPQTKSTRTGGIDSKKTFLSSQAAIIPPIWILKMILKSEEFHVSYITSPSINREQQTIKKRDDNHYLKITLC